MKKPILLLKSDLIEPIDQALQRIEKIRQRKASNEDKIILEGLFVLSVSSFETSLTDTLKILFQQIPEKLSFKTESIPKEEIIGGNFLGAIIERKVNEISYKNIKEILKCFIEITGINEGQILSNVDALQEIKATRNLLIHNNLKINNIYKEVAGSQMRSGDYYGKLKIDQDYLYNSILIMRGILEEMKVKLSEAYCKYTRIKAVEELFKFVFNSPMMVFADEFNVDVENDRIGGYKKTGEDRENSLGSTQTFFLELWLAHTQAQNKTLPGGIFYKLDSNSQEKLKVFMSAVNLLKN